MTARAQGWKALPWLCLDVETTGVESTDRIIEIAAVSFIEGEPGARHSQLVDPGRPIPEAATAVNGITDEMVLGKPPLKLIAPAVLDVVRQAPVLVAYNLPFDFRMIEAELGEPWREAIEGKLLVDPLVVTYFENVGRYWRGKGQHKLGAVAQRFQIPMPDNLHRASADAVLAGRVLWHLRGKLPNDERACRSLLMREQREQEQRRAEWLARQPKPPAEPSPSPPPVEATPAPITEPCAAAAASAADDTHLF